MMNQKLQNPVRWMAALASVCVIVLAGCGSDGPDAPATSTAPPPFGPWTDSSDIGAAALTMPGITSPAVQFTTDNAGGLIAYSTATAIEQGQNVYRTLFTRFTPALGWHSPYVIQVDGEYAPSTQVFPFRDKLKEDGLMVITTMSDRSLTHVVYGGTRWMLPVTTMEPPRSGYTLTADGTLLRSRLQTQPTLQGEVSKFSDGQWQSYKQFLIQVAGLTAADQFVGLEIYEYRDGVYGALGVFRRSPTPGMYPCTVNWLDLSGGLTTGSTLSGTRGEQLYCTVHGLLGRNDIRLVTVASNGSLQGLIGTRSFPHAYSMVTGQWVESVVRLRSNSSKWHGYTDQGALVAFGTTAAVGTDGQFDSSVFEGSTPVKITRASDGSQRLATGSWSGPISETAQFAILRDAAAPSLAFYERVGPASYLERTDFTAAYPPTHAIESGNAQYAVLQGGFDATAVFRVKWRAR